MNFRSSKDLKENKRLIFATRNFIMKIYFDNAATTPVAPEVIDVMAQTLGENYGNPSSIHAQGRKARAAIEQARKVVANVIDASIGEVFFTSCGTESNNMTLKCAVRDLGIERIISSKIEHHAITHTLETIQKNHRVEIQFVDLDNFGRPKIGHLESLLKSSQKKTLVSLIHANNEIGTMINLKTFGDLCKENNALFHTDTVQTMGYYPINVAELNINFLSASAHKFYGPKGVGFIYINSENIVKPLIDGGAQERNMRGGTENIAGIMGLAKALEIQHRAQETRKEKIVSLRNLMKNELQKNFKGINFNGDVDGLSHYKILSVSFPNADLLLMNLDIAGIAASGGSACASGTDVGSHVLTELGADPLRTTVRFSFSYKNTADEVWFVIEKLKEILKR